MSKLVLGTSYVSTDEPCFSLKELVGQAPGNRGWRRYQILKVMRQGDKPVEMRRDLGPAQAFTADEFCIPGGVVESSGRFEIMHTVGELVDIADYIRAGPFDQPEKPRPQDLIQRYHDAADQQDLQRRRRSSVGPLVRIQRD